MYSKFGGCLKLNLITSAHLMSNCLSIFNIWTRISINMFIKLVLENCTKAVLKNGVTSRCGGAVSDMTKLQTC